MDLDIEIREWMWDNISVGSIRRRGCCKMSFFLFCDSSFVV